MKKVIFLMCCWLINLAASAQVKESMYGDKVKADIKMKYVYSFEEALKKAKKENKLIFFNCFADWAIPCHGMNKAVFSDQEFADWMDKHFVNFFMDVTTAEGRPLAEKYNIRFQAHYLVLDSDGNIVHRIVGGCQLPEFKEKVVLALNPKTSLAGLDKRYAAGERKAKFLRDYALVLRTASEDEKYDTIVNQYFAKIKKSDWPKQENWLLFRDKLEQPMGEMFEYLIANKDEFVKNNGEEVINNQIQRLYFMPVYGMATKNKPYDGKDLLNIFMVLQKVGIPEDQTIFTVYHIAKYRGEKDYDKMMEVFEKQVADLDERTASGLDMSLKEDWKEMSGPVQARIVNYLTERAKQTKGSLQKAYVSTVKEMVDPEGIQFSGLSFNDALKKAKEDDKLIFMDCYTSWCGPCKMMSEQVFTQKSIGEYFNERFVNLKVDMEKGEGPELQKKYGVKAYPTLLFLDKEGRIVYKILGGSDARGFMEKVERISPATCYYQLKEKYEAGDRSTEFMPDYFLTMIDAGEMDNHQGNIRNYLNLLKDEEKFSSSTWKLYENFVTDYKMPEFKFICENRKRFAGQVGEEKVNKKIESILFPGVIGYLKNTTTKEELEEMTILTEMAALPQQFSLVYLNKVVKLYETKDLGKVMDYYENTVSGITDAHTKLNLDVLLNTLMAGVTGTEKERAVQYVKKCLDNADDRAVNTYKRLLGALQEEV